MNELTVFQNPKFGEFRTLERNGEPWFVLKDVCDAINLGNATAVANRLDKDELSLIKLPHPQSPNKTIEMICVNESGLYSVILRSDKPEAKPFRKWVTSEVLPAIRKTGSYQAKPMSIAENLAAQAQLLVEQEKRIARIEQRVDHALTAIARPQADNWIADMKGSIRAYCEATGLTDAAGRGRLYAALDSEANCNTDRRLSELRRRQKKAGVRYKDYMALTKLDAIAADKQLRVAFEGIVARETARAAK